jgi:hypothetical protein
MGWWDDYTGVTAAQEQARAQAHALMAQQAEAERARREFASQTAQGMGHLQQYGDQAAGALQSGLQGAMGSLADGRTASSGALTQGRDSSLASLAAAQGQSLSSLAQGYGQATQAYGQARGDLGMGYGQARADLGQLAQLQRYGDQAARGISAYDVTGAQDRLGGMLDQGLYSGFQQDPGYQFRQQQGEQAINRAASASGGRNSGATLKELAQFNQGLASQEFGNFAARRQAEAGMAGGSDAARFGVMANQAGRSDQSALSAQGVQAGLGQMGYGAQNSLANLATQYGQNLGQLSQAQGQLAYGYGGQQAGLHSQYGQNVAGMQSQYGQSLANLYQQSYGAQAGMQQQTAGSLGNLYSNLGSNMANASIGQATNSAQIGQNMMGAYSNYAQYGGMEAQARSNAYQGLAGGLFTLGGAALGSLSDARLKTDIEFIDGSPYEAIGLRGARWRWNDKAAALGLRGEAQGVIAQQVQALYPQAVGIRDGFLTVRYDELDRMTEAAR